MLLLLQAGIDLALSRHPPYVWATEFENVHQFWTYDEPQIVADGITCVLRPQRPRCIARSIPSLICAAGT